jgi:uncharacterized protein YecE (DUF72 family)
MDQQQDLFAEQLPPQEPRHAQRLRQVQIGLPDDLFLGTTSWTNPDWEGQIYPSGCPSGEYIEHYARTFKAVEIDSTWYGTPKAAAVEAWLKRTPDDFLFTAKVPRVISHEKKLVDCSAEMDQFLQVVDPLKSRLGPLLMQFGYVARRGDPQEWETGAEFIRRLEAFLARLPHGDFRFAVEVRNDRWIRPELVDVLRNYRVGLVLNHYYTMPTVDQVFQRLDPVTSDFIYVRFLGDRKRMDEYVEDHIRRGNKKRHWDRLVWDRQKEVEHWARHLKQVHEQRPGTAVYAFFNNHFAGYAPGTLGGFAHAWKEAP